MLPDDPKVISKIKHLQEVAAQMKLAAAPDDDPGLYTKTYEQANPKAYVEGMNEDQYKHFKEHGGNRAVVINGDLVSLCLTHNEHHEGWKWHLSMCRIAGVLQAKVSERVERLVMEAFFGKWQQIPNPGKMTAVTHYVGNDQEAS